jgi:hypothetical protein
MRGPLGFDGGIDEGADDGWSEVTGYSAEQCRRQCLEDGGVPTRGGRLLSRSDYDWNVQPYHVTDAGGDAYGETGTRPVDEQKHIQ